MVSEDIPETTKIHTLIQKLDCDFPSFITSHLEDIENHIEICTKCRDRMVGFAKHLPRLRARVTVSFPDSVSYQEQLERLERGQCLPCGCEVTMVPWSREYARARFCEALSEVVDISKDQAEKIPYNTLLLDLPFNTKSLRRLRDKFWLPDGSYGSTEMRDKEEGDVILQLPETVGDFIAELCKIHSGISFVQCPDHWSP